MPTYQRPVTPAEFSPSIRSLCLELVSRVNPLYVDVQPIPDSASDECFVLVPEQIRRNGGQAAIGWAIWEWPSLFVEAEFHCVWRAPDGSLLDVSPKKSPTQRILFLTDFLTASDAEYEFMNRGERAGQHGHIKVTGPEAEEYAAIQRTKANCFLKMVNLKPAIGAYDPCPCGSGKKVKWCHREHADAF